MIPNLDSSHAVVVGLALAVQYLAKALHSVIQQRRNGNGSDRRKPDTDAATFRALMTEKVDALTEALAKTRTDIHSLRDAIQPIAIRLALAEREMEHLKRERE